MTCHLSRLGYSALLLLLMWQDCKSGPQALLIPGTTSDLLRGTNGCSISVGFTQIILNKPEKSQALPSHETVSPNRFCLLGKLNFRLFSSPEAQLSRLCSTGSELPRDSCDLPEPQASTGFAGEPEITRAKASWPHSQGCTLKSHLSIREYPCTGDTPQTAASRRFMDFPFVGRNLQHFNL